MIMMGDRKKLASVILGPDGNKKSEEPIEPLKVIAQELIDAVHAKNPDDVIAALRAAHQELDAEPHMEGPDLSEES